MSPLSILIERIVAASLVDLLNIEGYQKDGRTFSRKRHKIVEVVNVQSSSANRGESGKFTLNLGVYSEALQRLIGNNRASGYPQEQDCTLRNRIGMLTPQKNDRWWELPGDESAIAQDVAYHWTTYGRPWMDALTDENSILRALFKETSFFMTSQKSLARGTPEQASARIRAFLARAAEVDEVYAKRVKHWAVTEQLL